MNKENRRQKLLLAARQVFAARGYHDASVSEIIALAGVARGTFYCYFDGKRAVFDALIDGFLHDVQRSVSPIELGPAAAPLYEQLRANVARILTLVLREHETARIVLRHTAGLDAASDLKLREFYDQLSGALERALTTGRRLGVVGVNPAVGARLLLGGVRELVQHLLEQGLDPEAREQIVDDVLCASLAGVLGRPGDAWAAAAAALPDAAAPGRRAPRALH